MNREDYSWEEDYDEEEEYEDRDYFNRERRFNPNNTSLEDYNCGGYAFDTMSWYRPYNEWTHERFSECYYSPVTWEEGTEIAKKQMLEDFGKSLREIESVEEIKDHERLILFRLSSEGDFHYVFSDDRITFHHKRGRSYLETMSKEEALGEVWSAQGGYGYDYESPLLLLAFDMSSFFQEAA